MTQSAPVPVPTDFPVQWSDPADEQLFWMQDAMHLPSALKPLDATMMQPAFSEGASRAIAKLSMPIEGLKARVYNGYVFLAPLPVIAPPEEMEARFEEMKRITMELGSTVLKDWRETFEPQVLAECDEILRYDYESPPTAEVAGHVAGFYDRLVKLWDIHMRVNIPPMNAVFGLEEFVGEVVGPEAVEQSRLMLQGFDNKSVETGRALWELSRWVRGDEAFASLLAEANASTGPVDVVDHPRKDEFLQRWQGFLDEYGWRGNRFIELGYPSWREQQATPLTQLQNFVAKPDGEDPYVEHRRQAADRDRLVAEMEAKLPTELLPQFRGMLSLAQQYIPIAEDHNFTIDQKAMTMMRHGVLQLGWRLEADGTLDSAEDIFYLKLDEIAALADGHDGAELQELVTARRAEHVLQEAIKPPPALGTPPPADMPPDPLVTKFFGLGAPPSTEERVLTGYGCSAGVATGTARVLLSLDEAGKLEAGDIMVCRATMPAWTPLFGVAGAVVADAGGPLSHCAIVAREYAIPCVAGTQVGTQQIKDGMRLRVDGGAGTVEILD